MHSYRYLDIVIIIIMEIEPPSTEATAKSAKLGPPGGSSWRPGGGGAPNTRGGVGGRAAAARLVEMCDGGLWGKRERGEKRKRAPGWYNELAKPKNEYARRQWTHLPIS